MRRSEPDPETAADQYLERAAYKVAIAEYHLEEFERFERELTGGSFFRGSGEPFYPVQAHGDAVMIQLAAAFDAFACAVAHRVGKSSPDKTDFVTDNEALAGLVGGELGEALREVKASDEHRELSLYRNLAAHRGVIGEVVRAAQGPDGRDEVRVLLPSWLPERFPDYPEAEVGPILHRYLDWARPTIERLRELAVSAWARSTRRTASPAELDLGKGRIARGDEVSLSVDRELAVSPESLAPTFGEWRAWHSSGSFDFGTERTDPPAWFIKRGDEPALRKDSAGLEVGQLRAWLSDALGAEIAKEVLRFYRPRKIHGTAFGTLLVPDH